HYVLDTPPPHSFPTRRSSDLANARRVHFRGIGRHRPPHTDEAPAPRHPQQPQGDLVVGEDPDRHEYGGLDQQYGKADPPTEPVRSEEHTSELQSPYDLVCRLL